MPEPIRLVVASANPDKVFEIRSILGGELGQRVELVARPAEVPDVEENATTLLGNARLKAAALVAATGEAAVADDTGLEVEALDGAPGVYSARYAGEHVSYSDNVAKLLRELEGASNRRATFRTVAVVTFPDGFEIACEGTVDGVISNEPRGVAGFGYDPVFIPDGAGDTTYAELDAGEKDAISQRGRAFRTLASALVDHLDAIASAD